jgi:hypothetical protein
MGDGSVGRLTVGFHLDEFIKLEKRSTRYVSRTRIAERRLSEWLRTRPEGNGVRKVNRRTPQDFITYLGTLGISAQTLQSMHSVLSSYGGWMEVRGDVEGIVARPSLRDAHATRRTMRDHHPTGRRTFPTKSPIAPAITRSRAVRNNRRKTVLAIRLAPPWRPAGNPGGPFRPFGMPRSA